MNDSLYCYPDSDVLMNKLGIVRQDRLDEVERQLTALRIRELIHNPIRGGFDLQHLCDIHFYIFQDLYVWAGKLRKVDIAKGNMFCNVMFLEEQAKTIFGAIRKENELAGLEKAEFTKRLAYHFSEINALHPFREGNGRAQREFIRELARHNNYLIDFSRASANEMLIASKDSFLCNYEKMEALFHKCLIEQNRP